MSSKPKKLKRPTPIDPIFRVPSGAEEEFVVTDDSVGYAYNNQGLSPINTPFGVLYEGAQGTISDDGIQYIPAPKGLVIFDQKIRRANGVVVVDIITQFDDVPGAERYELRVTKV